MQESKHGQEFNHDDFAHKYDADVLNEKDPIRTGYQQMMDNLKSFATGSKRILDLGCGTGNSILCLPKDASITGVDVSKKMMERAKVKTEDFKDVQFVQSDILNCFDQLDGKFDLIISTYVIHHLEADEKALLFERCKNQLTEKGKIFFGDLMFLNLDYEKSMHEKYPRLIPCFEEEFFWDAKNEMQAMENIGLAPELESISDLSHVIKIQV